jgi:hypothetical protein
LTSKSAWFRRNWSTINVAYFLVLVAAFWIVNGRLRGEMPPPFMALAALLFVSLGLDGLNTGSFKYAAYTAYRDKNPIGFWVMVFTNILLGGVIFFYGIRRMLLSA